MEVIRQMDEGVKSIISSGYSNDPVLAHHSDYGFDEVIGKPYKSKELLRVISKLFKHA